MLTGKPTFIGGIRDNVQQKIGKDKKKLPAYLSSEAHSLLKGKDASKRLGSGPGGSNEIKNHKWFKSIHWKKLEAREIQPSFRPNVAGKSCIANVDECCTSMLLTVLPVASPVTGSSSNFPGFTSMLRHNHGREWIIASNPISEPKPKEAQPSHDNLANRPKR